ncbi:hypothetical protein M0812_07560 [Anaeramoeba flamelloides]|uniref:Uncharacterized protein n=1 Tax=Anaeramoeba flamelloides TaxID=1746091 RepID=A0AAV8A3K4_9EUKA|nr:hypothetical protein M0812_07560 [Anaeramoeba flamelloides]
MNASFVQLQHYSFSNLPLSNCLNQIRKISKTKPQQKIEFQMTKKIKSCLQSLSNLDLIALQEPISNQCGSSGQKTLRRNQNKMIRQKSFATDFKRMKIKNLRTKKQESKCECGYDSKEEVLWLKIPTGIQIETVYSQTSTRGNGLDKDNDNDRCSLKTKKSMVNDLNISLSDLELEQKMIEDEDQQELLEIEKLLKEIQMSKEQAQIKLDEDLSQVLNSTVPNKVQKQKQKQKHEQENSRILYFFQSQVKIPTLDQFKKTREEYVRVVIGDESKDEIKYSPSQLKRIRRKRQKLQQEQKQNQNLNQNQKQLQQSKKKSIGKKKSRKTKHCWFKNKKKVY